MKISDKDLKRMIIELVNEAKIVDFPGDVSLPHEDDNLDSAGGEIITHDFSSKNKKTTDFYDVLCQIKGFIDELQFDESYSFSEDQEMKLNTLVQMIDDMADEEIDNDEINNEITDEFDVDDELIDDEEVDDHESERLLRSMKSGEYEPPDFDDDSDL